MTKEKFLEILNVPSPSGWETAGQKMWLAEVGKVSSRTDHDAYGNAWAVIEGQPDGPRVMIEAHADEIGFIVRHIDKKGFLSIGPIGGSDRTLAAARRIRIFGNRGEVSGIIGNTAIHLRDTDKDKAPEWKDLFVDVGANSDKEVCEMGITVGQPAIFEGGAAEFAGDRIVGRALDNRVGGWILAKILAELNLSKTKTAATIFAVNAIQEEIGSHGARMVAHRIRPDVAIVFDVTHATDTPGINEREHGLIELGRGPAISHGAANHPAVVRRLQHIAEKENIPLQHEGISRSTRTDADVVYTSREGIPTALVSIPLRYMHSPVEIISLHDVECATRLVSSFIRSLDKGERFHVLA